MELIDALARLAARHRSDIGFGMTAVALVLMGPYLNGFLRDLTKSFPWLLRYALFVVLCTVGYTVLGGFLWKSLNFWLASLSPRMILSWSVAIFLVLAWLAKRDRLI